MASLARLSGATLLGCLLATGASAQRLSPEVDGKTKSENVKSAVEITVTASRRYREAQALERNGDERAAVLAYEAAAQAGHGRAQMRLAQIYDKGNTAVKRDYAKALHWYEKARAQGLQVAKPHPYVTGR